MKGKASTLETLRFTLELLKRIPRTHKVSAPELYRQLSDAGLERDLRTVQRQLDELAQHAGLSRTALAERFREAMGDTPLNHLRVLRMQRAMRLLAETDHKLEAVAAEVGYQDAFSFSKVFKRTVGVSPKAFRQRDAADKTHPWRLSAG